MHKEPVLNNLDSVLENIELSKIRSKSPVEKIRYSILLNMIWTLAICLGLMVLLFFVSLTIQLFLGIVIIWGVWAFYHSLLTYKKLKLSMDPSSNLVSYLKCQEGYYREWQHTQENTALAIYPISITGGFLLGAQTGGQQDLLLFLSKKYVLIALGICWLVFIPLSYYTTKLLFYLGFNKHLKQLEQTIQSLEKEV